jgi:hypothetical protein
MPLITIATVTIPGWQGNTAGVVLRIYSNADFTAQSGTFYPRSVRSAPASLGTFYRSYACVAAAGPPPTLQIPQVQIDSTTDSPDNPGATYSAELWDSTSGKTIQRFGTFDRFALGPAQTNTTWAAIFAAEADD